MYIPLELIYALIVAFAIPILISIVGYIRLLQKFEDMQMAFQELKREVSDRSTTCQFHTKVYSDVESLKSTSEMLLKREGLR